MITPSSRCAISLPPPRRSPAELLAAPRPHPWLEYYRDFLRRGEGLAAVALATSDADASYRELVAKGIAARPPMDLARPVKLGGGEETARFRIIQLESKSLFICQHLTRELVWRREWQSHANGASELSGVALAPDPPFDGLPASIQWSLTKRRAAPLRHRARNK